MFDSKRYTMDESKELLPEERKKLAQEDFDYYFNEAKSFNKFVDFGIREGELKKTAFLLHQTAERLYTVILLVFTRYKPNTHKLEILRKLTNSLHNELIRVFPLDSLENRHLFRLLCKAYVDARYKPSYEITKEELLRLTEAVSLLKKIAHDICQEKIKSNFF